MAQLFSGRIITAMRQCSQAGRVAAANSLRPRPLAAVPLRPAQLLVARASSSMDNNISSQLMAQMKNKIQVRAACVACPAPRSCGHVSSLAGACT
jgi:hypothetical protein